MGRQSQKTRKPSRGPKKPAVMMKQHIAAPSFLGLSKSREVRAGHTLTRGGIPPAESGLDPARRPGSHPPGYGPAADGRAPNEPGPPRAPAARRRRNKRAGRLADPPGRRRFRA